MCVGLLLFLLRGVDGLLLFVQNPDDPSTFPDAQRNMDSVYSQGSRGSAVFSAQNGYQPAGIHYSGVAEI